MNELQDLVEETLYENNYLIVLDDMWNEDPVNWDKLLMVGACGSKILVTTQLEEVVSMMGMVPAYCLKGLLSEHCLTLFLRKAFEQGQEVLYPNLVAIASDIVQKCEGNPLLLVILGSSLHMETNEWEWDDVKDHDMWNSNQKDKILPALRVSYERLPSDLKVCLAYCSIFPKDCMIEIDKLIQLRVAEGLISQSEQLLAEGLISQPDESEDLEDIGIQYFQELLSRSFFQDVEEYRSVFTSICKLHDLVHDLVLSAAGIEFCTVNSHIQNISDEVRHVAFSDYDFSGKELPASLVIKRCSMPREPSQLVTLPPWLERASATLRYLREERCPDFAALPKWLENLNALEKLEKLFSLPEGILTNPKVLRIEN
ncbi:hypothetical protein RND71_010970 [Anisodus tanguticus]|uniref:NB-ARC domain-containing protein n=1 Tax=Anisodus tanguticus TaxID=243964 RepID=A0AAE1SKS7_9SOLA|nr:hypothetical protein RND71_010970 [Anisodus tanguticus]